MTSLLEIQPRLPVADVKTAYLFYHDILGFSCPSGDPSGSETFAILFRDQVGIQLVAASADHPAGRLTIWLGVADAQAEYQRLNGQVVVEWGPEVYWYGCREFAILDPDGHRIIFSSPSDDRPTCTVQD